MYRKCNESNIKPNKLLLNTVLEAGMRKQDSDLIYEVMSQFLEIKQEPHPRQLKHLSNIKHIPDRLFVLLRKNFPNYGKIGLETREFEKPTFRPQKEDKLPFHATSKYKRHKLKKSGSNLPKAIRKQIGQV